MPEPLDVDRLVDALIDREGGYIDHPADKGGPTCFGITEAVARAHGYAGPMRQLSREAAASIYQRLYWLRPGFDQVASRSAAIAAELFDTGVNMGPGYPRPSSSGRSPRSTATARTSPTSFPTAASACGR